MIMALRDGRIPLKTKDLHGRRTTNLECMVFKLLKEETFNTAGSFAEDGGRRNTTEWV